MNRNSVKNTVASAEQAEETAITIGIANSAAEKEEIYRFRYRIYVEEMAKRLAEADDENQLLYDEYDKWAVLIYAKIDGEIVGTLRVNVGGIDQFTKAMVDVFSMNAYQDFCPESARQQVALCTKLMVEPRYRNSSVLYLLMAKSYDVFYSHAVEFVFAYCNLHLLRLYEQMGFRRNGRHFVMPGYGLYAPIVLLINDLAHLRRVRSPFYRLARKKNMIPTGAVAWYVKKFSDGANSFNSQLVQADELWDYVAKRLDCQPTEAISLLRGLSIAEAKKFIHECGALVSCEAGDHIYIQGEVSYSYDILISGKLRSLTFQRPVKEYARPGQAFGANGLTENNAHVEEIVAVERAEILVLSGLVFPKISRAYPEIAHKIVKACLAERKKRD